MSPGISTPLVVTVVVSLERISGLAVTFDLLYLRHSGLLGNGRAPSRIVRIQSVGVAADTPVPGSDLGVVLEKCPPAALQAVRAQTAGNRFRTVVDPVQRAPPLQLRTVARPDQRDASPASITAERPRTGVAQLQRHVAMVPAAKTMGPRRTVLSRTECTTTSRRVLSNFSEMAGLAPYTRAGRDTEWAGVS
jgi:hypothetical protein